MWQSAFSSIYHITFGSDLAKHGHGVRRWLFQSWLFVLKRSDDCSGSAVAFSRRGLILVTI